MKTNQELRQWAENISQPGWGSVSQKTVREVLHERSNQDEEDQGFTRDEIRTITALVNEFNR